MNNEAWWISHGAAALAYLLFSLLLAVRRRGAGPGRWLLAASVATALWSAAATYESYRSFVPGAVTATLEAARNALWIAFLASLLEPVFSTAKGGRALVIAAFAAAAATGLLDSGLVVGVPMELSLLLHVGLAVVGLVLIETLTRTADPDRLWSLKFLAAGLGLMFAYDVFLFSEALLFHRLNSDLGAARGALQVLIVPVLAIAAARNRDWALDIGISRRAVFHSVSVLGSGIFVLSMAGAGYYLRRFGGNWGPLLQTLFLAGSVLLLLATLSSGRFRSALKLFISMHFFSYKYDYRVEWLRFIATLATGSGSEQDGSSGLRRRVIRAIADIFDSPGGAIWLASPHSGFTPAGVWNFPEMQKIEPAGSPFVAALEDSGRSVDIAAARQAGEPLPQFLAEVERGWLVVPLLHRDRLAGFVVLLQPRAARALDWEDWDLLRTVGRQAASTLAEHEAAQAIADTEQLEAFHRRFAFVAHDIKNLVSPLTMLVANAERHGADPAFQADLVLTVQGAVERMNGLLAELKAERTEDRPHAPVSVAAILGVVARAKPHPMISVAVDPAPPFVLADFSALATALGHLVQNALEATQGVGKVVIRGGRLADRAVIEIADDGPGMDPDFVRDRLFRPLASTKPSGYGIGAYQARALIRDQGGELFVESVPGRGTTMRILLPIVPDPITPQDTTASAPQFEAAAR
jgi:putative PEP-CTERM system histidine kinase